MSKPLALCLASVLTLLAPDVAFAKPADPASFLRQQVIVRTKDAVRIVGMLSFVGASLLLLRTDDGRVAKVPREEVGEITPRPAGEAPPATATAAVTLAPRTLDAPPPPALVKKAQLPTSFIFGFQLTGLVLGTVSASQGSRSESDSLSSSGGFGLAFEHRVNDYVAVGPALQAVYIPDAKGAEADFVLRLRLGSPVSSSVYPYFLLAPGVAVFIPGGSVGFSLSIGAGLAIGSTRAAFTFDLGYRMTFVSRSGIDGFLGFLAPQVGFQTSF